MKLTDAVNLFWGSSAKRRWLIGITILLLFSFLGAKEIWTQEHRWADIVSGMFYRHDFFHPYLGEHRYYDKPLLSYWLIAGFAWLFNELNTWALRLPSALAGLLAVWSIYRIGCHERDKSLGMLCAFMLVTTYYFIFWARISSADMLNVGGSLFAIAWYLDRKDHAGFFDYFIFFLVLALTSLCKGLSGAVVPVIAVLVDIWLHGSLRQHLRPVLFVALLPAAAIYFLPFWLSSHFGGESYGQNGLYLVYKENVLRYFQPFDHKGPIYTYFIYLPVYLLPWTLFFIPAVYTLPQRWKELPLASRWNVITLALLFIFFTLSGSRRSYYVLPIVPFAILMTAEWIQSLSGEALRQRLAALCVIFSVVAIFLVLDCAPVWYYKQYGVSRFATNLKREAEKHRPWQNWKVVMLDAETKLSFYLDLPPDIKNYDTKGPPEKQTEKSLRKRWPILSQYDADTIIISRKTYAPILDKHFQKYLKLTLPAGSPLAGNTDGDRPVAYIPVAVA